MNRNRLPRGNSPFFHFLVVFILSATLIVSGGNKYKSSESRIARIFRHIYSILFEPSSSRSSSPTSIKSTGTMNSVSSVDTTYGRSPLMPLPPPPPTN